MLYWAVGVQPENGSEEPINALIWGGLMGSAESRSMLLRGGGLEIATHSVYRPIGRLLNKLAAILVVDRHWLLSNDPRNHPGYANEAFRRLILQFIIEHRDENFMKTKVCRQLRQSQKIWSFGSFHLSHMLNQTSHDKTHRTRSSLSLSSPQCATK